MIIFYGLTSRISQKRIVNLDVSKVKNLILFLFWRIGSAVTFSTCSFLVKIRYIWSVFTNLSMDYASIAVLIGTALAAASAIFGAKYKKGKAKAKQLAQLLTEVIDAAEDNEVSEEEFQKIVTSSKQILEKSEA
jgi:hypothetical protein